MLAPFRKTITRRALTFPSLSTSPFSLFPSVPILPSPPSPPPPTYIKHPPLLELPPSPTPNLTLLLPPLPSEMFEYASTIHSYQTFLLSVARKIEAVRVAKSGV